jgi:hypothetical protein
MTKREKDLPVRDGVASNNEDQQEQRTKSESVRCYATRVDSEDYTTITAHSSVNPSREETASDEPLKLEERNIIKKNQRDDPSDEDCPITVVATTRSECETQKNTSFPLDIVISDVDMDNTTATTTSATYSESHPHYNSRDHLYYRTYEDLRQAKILLNKKRIEEIGLADAAAAVQGTASRHPKYNAPNRLKNASFPVASVRRSPRVPKTQPKYSEVLSARVPVQEEETTGDDDGDEEQHEDYSCETGGGREVGVTGDYDDGKESEVRGVERGESTMSCKLPMWSIAGLLCICSSRLSIKKRVTAMFLTGFLMERVQTLETG